MLTPRIQAVVRIDSPYKVVGVYALVGTGWILGSGLWVAHVTGEHGLGWVLELVKGLGFIAITTGLLFFLIEKLVAKHRAIEEALQESQLRWQFALEGAGDGLWDWNAETNRVYFSRQWKAMLGYAEHEIGDTLDEWQDRVHPEDRPRVQAGLDPHWRGETPVYVSEHRVRMKDGTYKWILDRGQIVSRAPDGRPRRMIGTHTDISGSKQTTQALATSQQRLDLALRAANQGLYDLNVQTGEATVNDTYASMLGYDPQNFRETNAAWRERLHPEDREKVYQVYSDYVAGRLDEYRVEFRQRSASGDWRWILSLGRLVERDDQGRPLRLLGTHTDITDRKKAEARSVDALNFVQTVLNASPMGILVFRADGGTVIANGSAARIVGTSLARLMQANFRQLDTWRQHGLLAKAELVLASGRELVHRGPVTTDFGRSIWLDARMVRFIHEDAPHLLLVFNDESEKQQAQENLRLMETAVRAAPVGWVVTDPEGRIEWVNPGFTTLTGYEAAEVIGQNPRLLKSGRHGDDFYQAMWAAIKRGEVWSGEVFNQRKDGRQYQERMTIAPVRDETGAIAHFVAIKQDVTVEKQLGQQLARAQRLESIGMLASGIAHDLNNIFAPIMLSIELLKLQYPAAGAHKTLGMVESAGRRGAGIIRQLLTFARGIEGERTEVQVKYVVREAAHMLAETLPRSITVETQVAPDLPPVLGDATQLHQVMLNLAINARDAMPRGGLLCFGARLEQVDEARAARNVPLKPGPCVALTVSDTGTGIPPEVLEHMFDPFFTTKPLGQGTGLGLSTVYGIVRGHGGAVEVSTRPGQGTTFTVLLPALDRPAGPGGSHPPVVAAFSGAGRRVLLVDDEEPIRLITLHALQRHDFLVEVAVDGIEALAVFRKDPMRFSAIITDLMMPRLNGRELVQEIRRLDPALPVIASSGLSEDNSGTDTAESLAALGVRILLRKPYTETELLAALRQELEPGATSAKNPRAP